MIEEKPLLVYHFECDDIGLHAVSLDPLGNNVPCPCETGWRMTAAFPLDVQSPVPLAIDPEPLLRGIRESGYFVWRQGCPHGTTQ